MVETNRNRLLSRSRDLFSPFHTLFSRSRAASRSRVSFFPLHWCRVLPPSGHLFAPLAFASLMPCSALRSVETFSSLCSGQTFFLLRSCDSCSARKGLSLAPLVRPFAALRAVPTPRPHASYDAFGRPLSQGILAVLGMSFSRCSDLDLAALGSRSSRESLLSVFSLCSGEFLLAALVLCARSAGLALSPRLVPSSLLATRTYSLS